MNIYYNQTTRKIIVDMEDYTFCVKNIPPHKKNLLQNMMGDMDGIYLKYWAYS
jgi:hypothetical protein